LPLYAIPASAGPEFAWPIKAALTTAFLGAGYLAGAALGLVLVLRNGLWEEGRIILATAATLVTTSLVATLRFWDTFAFGEMGLAGAVAWAWLAVYAVLPPALAVAFALHERHRPGRGVEEPLTRTTQVSLAAAASLLGVLGLWLFVAPEGGLAARWPWPLPPTSAAVVGTWLLTFATIFAWSLLERDWRRVRIGVAPGAAVAVLHLLSVARLSDGLTGSTLSVALYLAGLCGILVLIAGVSLSQRAARRKSLPASPSVAA
jgi:hypothetical protein